MRFNRSFPSGRAGFRYPGLGPADRNEIDPALGLPSFRTVGRKTIGCSAPLSQEALNRPGQRKLALGQEVSEWAYLRRGYGGIRIQCERR
jgi:hypothetical protein